jgi:Fe-S-cluster containining protein
VSQDPSPRGDIPTNAAGEEISCENCVGACCQWSGGNLFIRADDWHRHRQSMGLIPATPQIDSPRPYDREVSVSRQVADGAGGWRTVEAKRTLPANQMWAEFKGTECKNLAPAEPGSMLRPCRIYEDRPMVCRSLIVGSPACRNARLAAGLDGGTQITKQDTYKSMGLSRKDRRAARRQR